MIVVVTGVVAQSLHAAYRARVDEQTDRRQVLACLANANALADLAVDELNRHHDERAAA